MSVLHHRDKEKCSGRCSSRLSMGSVSHIEDGKRKLVQNIHRFARLGVRKMESTKDGVAIQNGSESSFRHMLKPSNVLIQP